MALCGLEETQTGNGSFNRPPRGTHSWTHTAYHADADKFGLLLVQAIGLRGLGQ